MAEVRVYVEGGGNDDKTKRLFRLGFAALIARIVPAGRQPRIVACGSREATWRRFAIALREYSNATCLLLVDSDAPVPDIQGAWAFLAATPGYERPAGADDDHAHLMVQCMEAWLIADPGALERFYDGGFVANALPARQNVEEVPKPDLMRALDAATRHTHTKGPYAKGRHSFALLREIDPRMVRARSRFAARFFSALERYCAD